MEKKSQKIDPKTPLWHLTVEDFLSLTAPEKNLVYGMAGLANLYKCSRTKAHRIKKSGIIDAAISQNGNTIIIDADLALKLFDNK